MKCANMKVVLLKNNMERKDFLFLSMAGVIFTPPVFQSNDVEKQFNSFKEKDITVVPSNFYFYDFLEFNSLDDVFYTFQTYEGNRVIQDLDTETAKKIWEDLEKDFLHVSEILRFLNLI